MYIIIIGCGRFGSNLAKRLSDEGSNICIIDRNGEKLNALGSGFNGKRIKGIEFDSDNLIEAGIKNADAVIAVTPDDNINITVSLIADKIFHVPRIIARVNDPEKHYFYQKVGIETINPVEYELEILKSKLPVKNLDVLYQLDDSYEIIEILANKIQKVTVGELEQQFHCIVAGIIKTGNVSLPGRNDLISNQDKVICSVHKDQKGKLINYLSKEMFL
ncbi:MAG TPA: TrkA family potassium uptake protein [Mobilitalea sp.]|nr:TrkA family potassium uptake protein [Mobilitalea sp.]